MKILFLRLMAISGLLHITDKECPTQNNSRWQVEKCVSVEQNQENNSQPSPAPISGLDNMKIYTKRQAEKGAQFIYSGRKKCEIKFFFEQTDVNFYAYSSECEAQRVITNFDVGYYYLEEEIGELKNNVKFILGQHDFNGDGVDELLVAIQDNDDMDNGISINVFEFHQNRWKMIGVMTGRTILGIPHADIEGDTITINRNLHGFYYRWILEDGKFKDYSNL